MRNNAGMTKIPDIPPYRDSMGVIFRRTQNAFMAHWRAHGGKPPQKLILTTEQAEDLWNCQRYGRSAMPGAGIPARDRYKERPVEVSSATVGEIVAFDGTTTPLSDYDNPQE